MIDFEQVNARGVAVGSNSYNKNKVFKSINISLLLLV